MTAHLTLPYAWEDCADPENCAVYTHLQDTAENLNSYPLAWVEELLGNCQISKFSLLFVNHEGFPHRDNGPAEEYADGTKEWYQNGILHRDNGPARENSNGTYWFKHGEHHRDDGPAIERADGKYWYQDGILHRVDGPAVVKEDGTQEWYQNGEYHREDGPAVENSDGTKLWYLNGVRQQDKRVKP